MKLRITAAAVLCVALAAPLAAQSGLFADVPEGHPYYEDVRWARAEGVFRGYADGSFKPDAVIDASEVEKVIRRAFPSGVSRAEMARMLRRHRLSPSSLTDRERLTLDDLGSPYLAVGWEGPPECRLTLRADDYPPGLRRATLQWRNEGGDGTVTLMSPSLRRPAYGVGGRPGEWTVDFPVGNRLHPGSNEILLVLGWDARAGGEWSLVMSGGLTLNVLESDQCELDRRKR